MSLCSYMIGLKGPRGAAAKMLKACLHQHAAKCVTCSLERRRHSPPRSLLLVIVVLGSQAYLRQRAPGLALNKSSISHVASGFSTSSFLHPSTFRATLAN